MGIEVRPKGEAESIAKAGRLIGEARQRAEEAERADAMRRELLELQQREELAQFQATLQMERAKMQQQVTLEAQRRAQEWELEKMEIRSRNDFLREEERRNKDLQEYELGVKIIEESHMSPTEKQDALFDLRMRKFAGYVPRRQGEELSDIDKILGGYGITPTSTETEVAPKVETVLSQPEITKEESAAGARYEMVNDLGQTIYVPAESLQAALDKKFVVVRKITPEPVKEPIYTPEQSTLSALIGEKRYKTGGRKYPLIPRGS